MAATKGATPYSTQSAYGVFYVLERLALTDGARDVRPWSCCTIVKSANRLEGSQLTGALTPSLLHGCVGSSVVHDVVGCVFEDLIARVDIFHARERA